MNIFGKLTFEGKLYYLPDAIGFSKVHGAFVFGFFLKFILPDEEANFF